MSNPDVIGRPLLVMFLCNHCPFVKHIRHEVAAIGRTYVPKGLAIAAISSNDPATYPADAPELMAAEACDVGYCFPYLFDATQDVARAFDAQCTPDFSSTTDTIAWCIADSWIKVDLGMPSR